MGLGAVAEIGAEDGVAVLRQKDQIADLGVFVNAAPAVAVEPDDGRAQALAGAGVGGYLLRDAAAQSALQLGTVHLAQQGQLQFHRVARQIGGVGKGDVVKEKYSGPAGTGIDGLFHVALLLAGAFLFPL